MTLKEKVSSKLSETRAVSPVIGVILMVAITVILAAIIGTFVMGLGNNVGQAAPQASLSVSSTGSNTVEISHDGGDALHSENTKLIVESNGETAYWTKSSSSDETFTVGDTLEIDPVSGTISNGPWTGLTWSDNNSSISTLGKTVTVKIIDMKSQKVIYKSEITV